MQLYASLNCCVLINNFALTTSYVLEGREYDKLGNLHQWWKNSTIKNFDERMKCFIEQYKSYSINNDHVSSESCLV